jgi:APA family basic amino acid/polyamine antiporter
VSDPQAKGGADKDRDLLRVLRVREGLAVLVGSLIGMGILRTPGVIANYLGDPWLILGIWFVGGVVSALGALLYAELATSFPRAGGKYVYATEAFGPVAGFVTGWNELAVAKASSGAAKAVVIAEYLVFITGNGSIRVFAILLILVFAGINLAGLRAGTLFQNITTLIKATILAGIAAAAFYAGGARGLAPGAAMTPETGLLLGLAASYQLVAFTYYGWDDVGKMAEEIKDPGRTIPRILLIGCALVTLLYMLIVIAFLTVLTPAEMAQSQMPAQAAIAGVFGETAGTIMILAGIFIIMNTLNVNFLVMPRVAFALSRDGLAPKAFTSVSKKGTPVPALIFATIVILALTVTGAFETLIRFYMLIVIALDLLVFIGLFRLRKLYPNLYRPFKVPLYPWLPLVTIALYAVIVVVLVLPQPKIAIVSGLTVLTLVVAGIITVRRNGAAVLRAPQDAIEPS